MITLMFLTILLVMVVTILFIVMLTVAGAVAFMPAILLIVALILVDIIFFKIMKAIFKGGD